VSSEGARPASSVTGASWTPNASPPPLLVKGFHEVPQPQTSTMLLAVGACRENHVFLKQVLRDTNWELCEARAYRDALMILCKDRMPVVICESCLPDGNWKDILSQVAVLPDAPRLIVTSREPDESLWAEVLNMGGYDVLATPFEKNEVIRAVSRAWQSWEDEWSRVNQRWRKPRLFAQSA
jgi:DNA-binding NtrC family response regulator